MKHYKDEFYTRGPLPLGSGTRVRILDLACAYMPRTENAPNQRPIRITAHLEVTADVTLVRNRSCAICGARALDPDPDGLWYIMENHDGDRLVFPYPEAEAFAHADRDRYPVTGWERINDEIHCAECVVEVRAAVAAVKAKRGERGTTT